MKKMSEGGKMGEKTCPRGVKLTKKMSEEGKIGKKNPREVKLVQNCPGGQKEKKCPRGVKNSCFVTEGVRKYQFLAWGLKKIPILSEGVTKIFLPPIAFFYWNSPK